MRQARLSRHMTVVRVAGGTPDARSADTCTHDLRDVPTEALMAAPAITVWVGDSLDTALRAFAVHGVRHLVVVDSAGHALGILTDRVVTASWAMRPMTFENIHVGNVSTGPPPLVPVHSSVADVARVMRRCASDAVAVVDPDMRPVGVVTASDLVAMLAKPRLP